jgi:predicted GNAT family acetyltransferase
VTRSAGLRTLQPADLPDLTTLLDQDPVVNVVVASRVHAVGLDPATLGARVVGWYDGDDRLVAACYLGPNIIPIGLDPVAWPEAVDAIAGQARRTGRFASSLVGPADAVLALWARLERYWGRARQVRADQPLMAIDHPSPIPPDPSVRLVRPDEVDILLPASVAMFTEEVGVSPVGYDGGSFYRARVAELVESRCALARIEDGRVVFKAEIGAATPAACQVQGVWVDPGVRNQGLATGGMAAVVRYALEQVAPVVSLYVNAYNAPALAVYAKVGFTQVARFATVLL